MKIHGKLTHRSLQKYVDAQANAFVEMGIKKGDTLAVSLPESAEKVGLFGRIAVAACGCVCAACDTVSCCKAWAHLCRC
jgi:acyl-coenzyme A synthetase/AMP-(fatty) acid ligase